MDIKNEIQDIIKENLGIDTFDTDAPITEYIKNSIDFIKIIVDVESKYSIEFVDEDLHLERFSTIGDFIQSIEEKIANEG